MKELNTEITFTHMNTGTFTCTKAHFLYFRSKQSRVQASKTGVMKVGWKVCFLSQVTINTLMPLQTWHSRYSVSKFLISVAMLIIPQYRQSKWKWRLWVLFLDEENFTENHTDVCYSVHNKKSSHGTFLSSMSRCSLHMYRHGCLFIY